MKIEKYKRTCSVYYYLYKRSLYTHIHMSGRIYKKRVIIRIRWLVRRRLIFFLHTFHYITYSNKSEQPKSRNRSAPSKCTMTSSSIQKSSFSDFQLNSLTFSKIISINFKNIYSSGTMNKC